MNVDEVLERTQWDLFWVPEDIEIVDRPEILYLRRAGGPILFNQVMRTRATAERLPRLVAEVVEAHADRASRWLVPATIPTGNLTRELAAAGYAVSSEHWACAIAVENHRSRTATGVTARAVDSMARLHDWLTVTERAFNSPHVGNHGDLERQLDECTRPGARVHRVVAYDDGNGEPLSAGSMTLYPDLHFGFLWAGGTVPEARGRGAYSTVLAARAAHASARGITHIGLYAVTDTSAPIVLRQGFRKHGPMTFWDRNP